MTDSGKGEIIKKKFSLTKYHDDLLEELSDQRHASRSAALRAAIERQHRYDNEIEQIHQKFRKVTDKLTTIQEQLDNRESVGPVIKEVPQEPAKQENESESNNELESSIAELLINDGPLNKEEVADRMDSRRVEVIVAIENLKDDGMIEQTDEDTDAYEFNT